MLKRIKKYFKGDCKSCHNLQVKNSILMLEIMALRKMVACLKANSEKLKN